MSRKSRRRTKPELVRERSAGEVLVDERGTVHRLTGELRDTLDAIISGCAFLAKDAIPPALLGPGDDEFQELAAELGDGVSDETKQTLDAELDEALDVELDEALDAEFDEALDAEIDELGNALGVVGFTTRILARALLARALDRQPPRVGPDIVPAQSSAEADVESVALDEIAHALLPSSLPAAIRPSRADWKAAFDEASFLVREVGLEEFDVSCELTTGRDGTDALVTYSLSPEDAHVSLLEFLFERAEAATLDLDPLLVAERDASSWEFSRWSVSPLPGSRRSSALADFARHVREQEYSLAARPTIALGVPVMGELAADEGFAELFPRQHRMAQALVTSFVDVFECVALDGRRVTLRSVRDGRTYAVHEHMDPVEYSTGWVTAGRLLPFDGELHLRSPGMIFVRPDDPDLARAAARALDRLDGTLPPTLALEAVISSVIFGVSVPRPMKPMRSKAEARDALAALLGVLANPELERDIMPAEITDALGDRIAEPSVERQLDATLNGFMAALAEQADSGSAPDGQSRTGGQRTSTRRSKRRRK